MTRDRNKPWPGAFQRFFRTEAIGGVVLMLCGCAALLLANSPWAKAYGNLWETIITVGILKHPLSLTLHAWINDGLMAVFFLLVGLEIKRELLVGELASRKQAALPIAGAIGGMILPALIYWALNPTGAGRNGWGIPMATDIAFALGALALIAPNAPTSAKVFLAALAIIDDMGAVLVIAIFYSDAINWTSLAVAASMTALLIGFNIARVRRLWPYLLVGVALWFFVHESGVHATVAGVVLAFCIPTRTRIDAIQFSGEARALLDKFDRTETGDFMVLTSKGQQETLFALEHASEKVTAPILRLEHSLHNFSAFVVMPLFALANAGVTIGWPIRNPGVGFGVLAGLIIGKPLGITLAIFIAVKLMGTALPDGMRWASLHGYAWLAGIGFTMSLFIAMLAFEDPALVDAAKVGILVGSLLAGIVAACILSGARGSISHRAD